ncbi:hypothetical protein K438DRAFT_1996059 [Mycena galopus ATCC 62051]|nr:hypothetical protein K438DRAFT_1996059 [Mycena galopus ATCC 62051]
MSTASACHSHHFTQFSRTLSPAVRGRKFRSNMALFSRMFIPALALAPASRALIFCPLPKTHFSVAARLVDIPFDSINITGGDFERIAAQEVPGLYGFTRLAAADYLHRFVAVFCHDMSSSLGMDATAAWKVLHVLRRDMYSSTAMLIRASSQYERCCSRINVSSVSHCPDPCGRLSCARYHRVRPRSRLRVLDLAPTRRPPSQSLSAVWIWEAPARARNRYIRASEEGNHTYVI